MKRISSWDNYLAACERAQQDPDAFWADIAASFVWDTPWTEVMRGSLQDQNYQWFIGGKTNLSVNCLDRHLATRANQPALIWEPNSPFESTRTLTYRELSDLTNKIANLLLTQGVNKGDRVVLYAPMLPETIATMLACTRIGAIHCVVFAGFSAQALADRLLDTDAKMVITAPELERGNKTIPLAEIVQNAFDLAGRDIPTIEIDTPRWESLLADQSTSCPPVSMDSEDPLFILYTSGSTGKPKGLVHTVGGYMVYAGYSFENVFQPQEKDVFWCTADVGWITGHTYLTYGPLLAGSTTVIFGGTPTYPDPSRFWQVIERHKVNILYTAPTVIRTLAAQDLRWFDEHNLSSLRTLGSVGEPLNVAAWEWYNTNVGGGHCPIVDTWWQTETGGILISSLAGITPTEPGYAAWPLPGIAAQLVDDAGQAVTTPHQPANLVITKPWPSLARGIWGDTKRFRDTYLARFPGSYWTGDGAWQNEDNAFRITGRVDDVINVSGHRIGTAEVENALTHHAAVVEAAVIGYPHEIKGEGLYAFVVCYEEYMDETTLSDLRDQLENEVVSAIGAFAKPDFIQIVPNLPKTRSGKIMRRLLRKLVQGDEELGDTSTLLDPDLLNEIKKGITTQAS